MAARNRIVGGRGSAERETEPAAATNIRDGRAARNAWLGLLREVSELPVTVASFHARLSNNEGESVITRATSSMALRSALVVLLGVFALTGMSSAASPRPPRWVLQGRMHRRSIPRTASRR